MDGALDTNQAGQIANPVSPYQPGARVKDATARVLRDFQAAVNLQTKSRHEFDNRSLLQEIDRGHRAFNSYVPPKSTDPEESWRAQTVRPLTRNKIISVAAHVTANVLFPNVFAQDEDDQDDRLAAQVMKDLMEYTIDSSDYARVFVQAAVAMMVEPCVIMKSDYYEVKRTVKRPNADGSYREEEIVDDALSGYCASVVPAAELLIANFYEKDIQKQAYLMRSRYISVEEAREVYRGAPRMRYVRPGVTAVLDPGTRTFYDVADRDAMRGLVHELVYESRADDLRLVFLGGVLVTDPDEPNPRMDKRYGYAKAVYEPIGNGECFYGKSGVAKLADDQAVVDTLYNMVLDGSFLALMPPMASYGNEAANADVFIPGTVSSFRDPNMKIESLGPRSDLRAGLEAISLVERSMSESSQDPSQAGVADGGAMTARQALILQGNAKTQLGLIGKALAWLVEDFGDLRVGEILQHMTVAELGAVAGDASYKSFLVRGKVDNGKKVSRKIEFSSSMLGSQDRAPAEAMSASYDLLDREGLGGETRIYQVNPEAFRTLDYHVVVSADELMPRSKEVEKALKLEAYDRAIQNPVVDQEAVTRDFLLDAFVPGEADKYLAKQAPTPPAAGMAGLPNRAVNQKGVDTSFLSQLTGSNSLGVAASTDLGGTATGTLSGQTVTPPAA